MSINNDDFDILSSEEDIEIPSAPEFNDVNQKFSNDKNYDQKTIDRLQEYERNLVKLDRLFISRGARFVLVIPIFVIILYGFAESFTGSEPDWWIDHVLPVIPFDITIEVGLYYLAFFFIVADLGLLCLLLLLLSVTRRIFNIQSNYLTKTGLTFRSAHGYAEMKETIEGSFRQVIATTFLMFLSGIFLISSLQFSDIVSGNSVLLSFSTGFLLCGHGVHMVSDRSRFNTCETWGMLDSFSPPIHPALLKRPFSDVISAHVDPLLSVRISEYLRSIQHSVNEGNNISELQEKLLHLLHLRRAGYLDEEDFRSELEIMMPLEIIDELFRHPELGEETWDRLIIRAKDRCASFFRLHDRLRMKIDNGINHEIWFDVDMENLVVGQANLFAYVLNNGPEPVNLILKIQTPDFRPSECVYKLRVNSSNALLSKIDNESFVQKLPSIIKSTEIVWQSLLPEEPGEATVTVRLEDEEGNLLSGRVLTVQNRADLFTRLRVSIGAIFLIGAGLAIISPILPFFTSLLGL
ncbi:MAG: hypothetical protein QGG22_00470 [Candidatus Thalassarchaeaceae archaeon]|nr:hypothetical protein [Candidatus Thalassarchaeaceae archaeon]